MEFRVVFNLSLLGKCDIGCLTGFPGPLRLVKCDLYQACKGKESASVEGNSSFQPLVVYAVYKLNVYVSVDRTAQHFYKFC